MGGRAGATGALVAAAVVFGLAVGNHSLTLLLAPPIALYVVAVDRRHPAPPAADRALRRRAGDRPSSLVYLELPLRAGPFRAPLVYGRPDTWDGFWYVALAEQFRGSVVGPFDDLAGKLAALVDRTVDGVRAARRAAAARVRARPPSGGRATRC